MRMKKIVTYLSTIGLTGLSVLSFITMVRAVEPITPIPINPDPNADIDPIGLINLIGGWLLAAAGSLVIVYLIWGGIKYITGGANAEKEAKVIIMNALIGLIVITLAYALVTFVTGLI